jgi:hypothetical protein
MGMGGSMEAQGGTGGGAGWARPVRLKSQTPAQALHEALGVERLPAFAPPVDWPNTEEETVPAQSA